MQRELEVLDVMTANRDKAVWAVAAGRGPASSTTTTLPPFIPVDDQQARPAARTASTSSSSGEEAISKMTVGKGMKVNLFASEKEFPELVNPVQMAFDTKGRLWVAVWPTYPHWKPKEPMNDKLLILEDTDGDGKADKCTVFADDLHNPTGFEFWNGGVLVAQAPDLLFLKDTDGDDKADVRAARAARPRLGRHAPHGQQLRARSRRGALLPGRHVPPHAGRDAVRPAACAAPTPASSATSRGRRSSTSTSRYGFANPHGHVFDRWGQDIVVDGTGAEPYHAALFSGHLRLPAQAQPAAAGLPAADAALPRHRDPLQPALPRRDAGQPAGRQRHRLPGHPAVQDRATRAPASPAPRVEPILSSTDPNFRPSDLEDRPRRRALLHRLAEPDHRPHAAQPPRSQPRPRDTAASIASPTKAGRCSKPAKIAGEPIEKLLDLLKEPEDRVRYRATIELSGRDQRAKCIAAVEKWIGRARQERPRATSTTCSKPCGCISTTTSSTRRCWSACSRSPDFRARAAADARAVLLARPRLRTRSDLLQEAGRPTSTRASGSKRSARPASSRVPEAVEVAADRRRAADGHLPRLRPRRDDEDARSVSSRRPSPTGKPIAFTTDAGARYFLKNVGTERPAEDEAHPRRAAWSCSSGPGVRDEHRREAAARPGQARQASRAARAARRDATARATSRRRADDSVVFDLVRLLTGRSADELAAARGRAGKAGDQRRTAGDSGSSASSP